MAITDDFIEPNLPTSVTSVIKLPMIMYRAVMRALNIIASLQSELIETELQKIFFVQK